jgi:protoporphyrinogen/coproporphyrinogen III oxidase
VGGVRDSDALKWNDDELVALVVDALRPLVGLTGRPEFVRVLRHPRAIPQYLLGHADRVARLDHLLTPFAGLSLAGNYLQGVSVRDCLTQGMLLAGRIADGLPDGEAGRKSSGSGGPPVESAAQYSPHYSA